ncbi:hypothetical protein ACHAXS_010597, partial [Conticribra weissflogii]
GGSRTKKKNSGLNENNVRSVTVRRAIPPMKTGIPFKDLTVQ